MNKQFLVTAKFFMDSGAVKRVDWVEEDLMLKRTLPTKEGEEEQFERIPIVDVDTAKFEFRKLIGGYLIPPPGKRKPFTTENIKDKVVFVDMNKVEFIEVDVTEYKEEKAHE